MKSIRDMRNRLSGRPPAAGDAGAGATGADSYRYWAFISYSSKDKPWARWLHRAIESYGIPARLMSQPTPVGEPAPKRLRPVFRDRAELPASADLGAEIEDALRASRYLIVICSPNAAQSVWVDKEVQTFQRLDRPGRTLALIVDGAPHAGDDRECFPAALGATQPGAADVRPGRDSKNDAKLKLLAGMLGIGFDALKQRDTRRRIRRLQAAIGVVLAVALGFLGVALYAQHQRDKAVKSRNEAESLVGYLMYDLANQLKPLERWDIIQATQDRVDAYYQKMGVEEGGLGALRNQAQGMCTEGLVLEEQGNLEGALAEYRDALARFADLASSHPDDGLLQSDLSWTHGLIAGVLEPLGDLEAALAEEREAVAIDERLVVSHAGDELFQRRLALSHYELGSTLDAGGDLEAAMQELRKARTVVDAHAGTGGQAGSDLNEAEWQRLSSLIRSNIGWVLEEQGDLDAALPEYREALVLMEPLTTSDPTDLNGRWELAKCHNNVARALEGKGDVASALPEYQEALTLLEPLTAIDPGKTEWLRLLSYVHEHIGWGLEQQGDLAAALPQYRAGLATVETLAAKDPGNAGWQEQLALSHNNLGGALELQGDHAAASAEYQVALDIVEALVAADPSDAYLQDLLTMTRASVERTSPAPQAGPK